MKISISAFIAGYFDADGCIGYARKRRYPYWRVDIVTTTPEILCWIDSVLPRMGRIYKQNGKHKDGHKRNQVYVWTICKRAKVRQFLRLIQPFAIVKRAQINQAILELS